jgi:LuxR family maltose regulon positive regulatory protein
LTELRAADLRFTLAEATTFLNQVMGLQLAAAEIAALESRTEGWIAGLQLAALALQGNPAGQEQQDAAGFIHAFSGSHHFVLDYLLEEVLHRQPEEVQLFLLRTSILNRLCGPLCDAVVLNATVAGAETLAYLERANLFIIPLDGVRRWYRYHHLFAELLRQRLQQRLAPIAGTGAADAAELHIRASQWFEENGLELEAFHHAAAAGDIERAARLAEGRGMPLLFRGAVAPVLNWLAALPAAALDARPALWVMYASALLFVNQIIGIEEKLQAAEAALSAVTPAVAPAVTPADKIRDLIGHIALIRATVAVTQHQTEIIVAQSHRALAYLHPGNLPMRTATTWTLGYAYQLEGNRVAAGKAYGEAIAASQAIGHFIITLMATIGLGHIQQADNQLGLAAETYRHVLKLAGEPPLPVACQAHLGLGQLCYEWNDLAGAEQHGQQSLLLARQIEKTDRFVASQVFLARLKIAQGDLAGASTLLAQADHFVRQHQFVHQMAEVAAAQVQTLLRQGHVTTAAQLAQLHELPLSRARVHLAQGETAAALAVLESRRRQTEEKGWADERLAVMVLQAVAQQAHGEAEKALQLLGDSLALAEPGGFVRLFVDEGSPMVHLLSAALAQGMMPAYAGKLLAALEAEAQKEKAAPHLPQALPPTEPLSQRELDVLRLIAQGLSNQEIGERLFLALDTVKGHNRRIYDKLQVQRRTEAVARARALNLL